MLISLAVPAFAETEEVYTPVPAKDWNELVKILANLNSGDKVEIDVAPSEYNIVRVNGNMAYISASNVKVKFVERDFWYDNTLYEFDYALFGVGGDNVTLDFGNSQLQSKKNAAIMVDGNACTIKNAEFYCCENNNGWGGGIWITNDDPDCNITDCTFYHCNAEYGGGIFIDSNNATVSGCKFIDCTCSEGGADIYDNNEDSTVIGCRTTHSRDDNAFAYVKKIESDCSFGWDGQKLYLSSTISGGNIWIIAGVAAVAVITVAAVVISKKKKKTVQ